MPRIYLFFLGLLLSTAALADWTGKGEAGLVISTGNTETKSANLKIALANETDAFVNKIGSSALYAWTDDEGTTAQRWDVYGETHYNFSPRNFVFAAGRYEDDRFSGFEYQAALSGGVGRKFIDNERTKFVGTVGVGYKFFETRDVFDEETGELILPGDSENEVIFRGTLDFEHQFTETTSLVDKFIVEAGAENTFLENGLSLQVKMTDVLALAVGYVVRHNTDPPAGFEKTDTLTTINLVYELK
jgi:putative salt-induced outer membrane protein